MSSRHLLAGLTLFVASCSTTEETPTGVSEACVSPSRMVDNRCLEPGVQDDGCPAGTLGLGDGSCEPAGIPPQLCAEGFEADGQRGCEPILPTEPCPPGLMAVPGDIACRAVALCGSGPWGDIPLEPSTIYVDASYAGMDSDGSASKPWTTIADAYLAAPEGALIAVAAGTYAEDVMLNRRIRLWGVCPAKVQIVGSGAELGAVGVIFGSGSEIHTIAASGMAAGINMTGSENVLVDRVWIHDVGWRGINTDVAYGPTSLDISGTLIEGALEMGMAFFGVHATVEGSVVRDTHPLSGPLVAGIGAQLMCTARACDATTPSSVTVHGSLFERNPGVGIVVAGSEATIEGSVIHNNEPESDQMLGVGIGSSIVCLATGTCYPEPSPKVSVVASLVEHNHLFGVGATSGDTTIEASVIRSTQPRVSDGYYGNGVNIEACPPETACARPRLALRFSRIELNHDEGVRVIGADAIIEGALFRDNLPRAFDHASGNGLGLACDDRAGCPAHARANGTVRGSLFERNHDVGLSVSGAEALLEGIVVRNTLPRASDGGRGRGIQIEPICTFDTGCLAGSGTSATLRSSLVERNHDAGVIVIGSTAVMEYSIVRDTSATNGRFGDGVMLASELGPASATLTNNRIDASARAGISSFGAFASLGGCTITCAAFALAGDPFAMVDHAFEDRGANSCGCPVADGACKVVSAGLEPPDAIE